jgi:BirA family biotin operon repressor/biotin-[acetyl-CoA-carboxylase] ligase
MDREVLLTYYRPHWLGLHLECRGEVTSTNDAAMALLARRGRSAHGAVIFADGQTAGRGRFGRTWYAPAGMALAASIALWPVDTKSEDLALLPLACALSVLKALERSAGLTCRLKWPNDVLCRGRKISGTMAEARWQGENPAGMVLGIGINLNQTHDDWPGDISSTATSVREETGRPVQTEAMGAALLEALEGILENALPRPRTVVPLVSALWEHELGDGLEVLDGQRTLRGRFAGVEGTGALLLDTEAGRLAVRYGDARKLRRIS